MAKTRRIRKQFTFNDSLNRCWRSLLAFESHISFRKETENEHTSVVEFVSLLNWFLAVLSWAAAFYTEIIVTLKLVSFKKYLYWRNTIKDQHWRNRIHKNTYQTKTYEHDMYCPNGRRLIEFTAFVDESSMIFCLNNFADLNRMHTKIKLT